LGEQKTEGENTVEKNKKNGFSLGTIAILLMFMATSGGTFENPAIQTTIEAWPEVDPSSIMMMITIPNITSVVAVLIFGAIVGKQISYRMGNLLALICSLAGGLLPIFYCPNWTFMLVMRGVLGVAVGYYGVRNALLIRSVEADQVTRFIGFGGVVNGITSTVVAPVVGYLAGFGWRYALWCNAVMAVIGIANLLWLKEPEKEQPSVEKQTEGAVNGGIPMVAYVFAALQFLHVWCIYPLLLGVSTFVSEKALGSAVVAGSLVAVFQASGLVINLILPLAQKCFGKCLVAVSFLFSAAGLATVVFVPHILAVGTGVFMVGIGFLMTVSMLQVYNGMVCDAKTVTFTSSMILAANQIGVFSSTYFMKISDAILHRGSQVESAFLGASIVLAAIATAAFIFKKKLCPEAH